MSTTTRTMTIRRDRSVSHWVVCAGPKGSEKCQKFEFVKGSNGVYYYGDLSDSECGICVRKFWALFYAEKMWNYEKSSSGC